MFPSLSASFHYCHIHRCSGNLHPHTFSHLIMTGEYPVPPTLSTHVVVTSQNNVFIRMWLGPVSILTFTSTAHSSPITSFSVPSLDDFQVETLLVKNDETRRQFDLHRKFFVPFVLITRSEKKLHDKQHSNNHVVRSKANDD
ncbi:hypothetical protein BLNAU_4330 [Blattamonas nauphoetae]|uniref:Uncharacterized protein n=1 Tax=Blattamonas nauphoetae TaxID=2049346 RepID=A0ABQ9YAE1_9EUKA|nr:hypothetical protein BLNAU_7785 [Blattamonas nauphoetae]KAK2960675.1 hypothetical protein BLNAU_4330 [Blattamonas nauphoetae]